MNAFRTPARAFGGEVNDNVQRQPATHKEKPRKREKPSAMCKTPPSLIQNVKGQSYTRGVCIGEGGFARCFQVNSRRDGALYAAKTIAKTTLSSEKTKTKLLAEIKIHRSMAHSNVVQFVDCFEDDVNVYILLEMCTNSSLLDMVRARHTLSEPETRFFMVQMLGAVNYMHGRNVIHRDLKLGNVFIDDKMNLKIGDFGLAARLEHRNQRRYTICGTPNYIAPELLIGNHEHHFSTDIWAMGIIMFAMLFNKPPFQERDVNVIYERIKRGDLRFPAETRVSSEAIALIRAMLNPFPDQRPSISKVLDHPWFLRGQFPAAVPVSALTQRPHFEITQMQSQVNFSSLKISSALVMPQPLQPSIEPVTKADVSDESHVLPATLSPANTRDKYRLVMINDQNNTPEAPHDSPIVSRSNRLKQRDPQSQSEQHHTHAQQQWARAAVPALRTSTKQPDFGAGAGAGAAGASQPHTPQRPSGLQERRRPRPLSTYGNVAANAAATMAMRNNSDELKRTSSQRSSAYARPERREVGQIIGNSLHAIHNQLVSTIEAYQNGVPRPRYRDATTKPIFLTKWADFTEVWGLSYGLNDGGIGMKFKDNTSMRHDPIHETFAYYSSLEGGAVRVHPHVQRTAELAKKIDAVLFGHRYMKDRLGHSSAEHRSRNDSCDGVFVQMFDRGNHYMMFVLSDGTMQFNFDDHNKIVLFNNGEHIHIITAQRKEFTISLVECVYQYSALAQLNIHSKLLDIVRAVAAMS